MVHCSVPTCSSDSSKKKKKGREIGDKVSFHEFPVVEDLRKRWLKAVSRLAKDSKDPWKPGDRATICSKHFLPTDFRNGLKIRKLRPESVPSIFPGYPKYMQTPPKPQRRVLVRTPVAPPPPVVKVAVPLPVPVQNLEQNTRETEDLTNKEIQYDDVIHSYAKRGSQIETANRSSITKDAAVNTTMNSVVMENDRRKLRALQKRFKRMQNSLSRTKEELEVTKDLVAEMAHKLKNFNVEEIERDCKEGNPRAEFLREQMMLYSMKTPRWSSETVRNCMLWHLTSKRAYEVVREAKILNLPALSTLKRYLSDMVEEDGNGQDMLEEDGNGQDMLEEDGNGQDMLEEDGNGQDMLEEDGNGQDMLEEDGNGQDMLEEDGNGQDMLEEDGNGQDMLEEDGNGEDMLEEDGNGQDIVTEEVFEDGEVWLLEDIETMEVIQYGGEEEVNQDGDQEGENQDGCEEGENQDGGEEGDYQYGGYEAENQDGGEEGENQDGGEQSENQDGRQNDF